MMVFERVKRQDGVFFLKVHDPYQPGLEAFYYPGDRVEAVLDSVLGAKVVEGIIREIWGVRIDVEVKGVLKRCHYVDICEINLV